MKKMPTIGSDCELDHRNTCTKTPHFRPRFSVTCGVVDIWLQADKPVPPAKQPEAVKAEEAFDPHNVEQRGKVAKPVKRKGEKDYGEGSGRMTLL